ncbi:MAG TPA: S8 family serine peptidase, partial [Lachnospiraceae bacterium]|nr:S8 family serine peptidase [Lachnospiraceae bacterium]
MRRKFLALAMVTTLLTTTAIPYRFVNAAFNPESSNSLLVTTSDGNVRQSLDSGAGIESTYGDEDIVTVIVELNEDSLLENFNEGDYANTSTYDSNAVTSYLTSDNAEVTSDKLLSRQETVVNKIENLNKRTSNDVDLKYNYTTVMNGFAINVKYGMFDKIKAMPEVKTAYIAGTYALDDPAMTTSNGMIGSNGTWDLNYKGEGMVVAILDTGLDYEHEAFTNTNLSNPRLTESDIEAAKQLASPVANGPFVNAKVPFSYDYADDDSDVKPSMESVEKNANDHGTHVAGTVAGDSSTIQGVAPQAQLLIMKVFSDVIGKKGAETEDILAGLEDAVKLGADVINMSLGSSSGYSEGEEEGVQEVYNSIVEAGINLSVSAGNSYSATYNNEAGGAYSENPDTSIVGSPSTYPASTSVASIINTGYYASYIGLNGAKITYTETAVGSQPKFTDLVQTGAQQNYEYYMVPNTG